MDENITFEQWFNTGESLMRLLDAGGLDLESSFKQLKCVSAAEEKEILSAVERECGTREMNTATLRAELLRLSRLAKVAGGVQKKP